MVTAEISYNPYLLQTDIKFNGNPPRINSLVEKYEEGMLQSWIKKLPSIFHDEMNGYDFELIFSGTNLDFHELKIAFADAGVTDDQVHLFHKNLLGERKDKLLQLEALLKWIDENPNEYFDYLSFKEENRYLLDRSDSYIILQGQGFNTSALEDSGIAIELVDIVEKLDDTDLLNTPLLICLDGDTLPHLSNTLSYFYSRRDVSAAQLFFFLYPSVELNSVRRVICDLGIKNPQIVNKADDESIRRYIEIYSTTDYISNAIKVLRKTIDAISATLEKSKETSEKLNTDIHSQMDDIEASIGRIKAAIESFEKRGSLEIPDRWFDINSSLENQINNWKKKKTRITREDEADRQSHELNDLIHQAFVRYTEQMTVALYDKKMEIDVAFSQWYREAEIDTDHHFILPHVSEIHSEEVPDIVPRLLQMKEMAYITPKEDLVGMFFKTNNAEPVLEISYYYQNWRECAWSVVKPITDRFTEACFAAILDYDSEAANSYIEHLESLLNSQTEKLANAAASLSAEEQKLQSDIRWAQEFDSQLTEIERG